jgi:endoglucanase
LRGNRLVSRCVDNRVGCYVALETARRIAERGGSPGDVIAAAAVQEEVGDYAGARTVAFATEPDVAVAIDVTHTSDVRGADPEDEGKILLGGGPTVARGPSIHPDVFERLHDAGESEGIPFAIEVSSTGDTYTDADALYLSRAGVATGLIGIPLRYMHSPIETLDLDDVENAVQLLVAFASKLEPGVSFAG